jgi:outer membrane protein assembly factor BamB
LIVGVCALAASASSAAPLQPGELLVLTDFGELHTVDPGTGESHPFAQLPTAAGGKLAFDAAGHVLVGDRFSGSAYRIDRNTGAVSLVTSGGYFAGSFGASGAIAFESSLGIVLGGFVQPPSAPCCEGRVVRVADDGTQTLVGEGNYQPMAIAIASGSILVAASEIVLGGFYYGSGVLRLDPLTGIPSIVSSGGLLGGSVADLEVASDGTIFVLLSQGTVVTVDPQTGGQLLAWNPPALDIATGIALDGAGGLYLAVGADVTDETWPGGVVHVSASGVLSGVTSLSAFYSPTDVAVVPLPEPDALALLGVGVILARTWSRSRRRAES